MVVSHGEHTGCVELSCRFTSATFLGVPQRNSAGIALRHIQIRPWRESLPVTCEHSYRAMLLNYFGSRDTHALHVMHLS